MSVNTTIVPAGYAIKFQSHRPRAYWIMDNPTAGLMLDDEAWGDRVDSVTTVLKVLDKPALPWWGMETGIAGILELVSRGEIVITQKGAGYSYSILNPKAYDKIMNDPELLTDVKRIAKLLTRNKLTVNHVRDKAGDRGHNAHAAFETWCETGILPAPQAYPEEERGYIVGLLKFLDEHDLGQMQTEVMVASREHRVAGRYDARGPFDGKLTLLDVKTSKRVYASHFLQLSGYEGMSVESGYEPTEQRIVVHVTPEGTYDLKDSREVSKDGEEATFEDFLAIVRTQRVVKRLGGL